MSRLLLPIVLSAAICLAQTPSANTGEVSTKDESVVFKSKVTLVLVPVVVRDKNGKTVGTLQQEDFQLFDKGKPQTIVKFSVENPGGTVIHRTKEIESAPALQAQTAQPEAPPVVSPDHFVGLLFDDVHVNYTDLQNTRAAAQKFIAASLKPADRVAVFTTSGHDTLDFTDDRNLLDRTLLKLSPHPLARALTQDEECPNIGLYEADRIINKDDPDALRVAVAEVMRCMFVPPQIAVEVARSKARDKLRLGEEETSVVFSGLNDAVQRLARMPGQRTLILASPGFFLPESRFQDQSAAIDLAIRSGVVINSLNARGLFTIGFDVSKRGTNSQRWQNQESRAAFAESGALSDLAAGTGGTYIQNTNDLAAGFQQLGTSEIHYILGFSPQNLKLDGGFHSLKVTVKAIAALTATARPGYYAPTHLATAEEEAKEEITQALFSTEEMRDIPIDIHTQFFKASESDARLAVISRVDVRKLRFAKTDGRNTDDVRIISALFDRNGNYLQSVTKIVQLRLLDETLRNTLDPGISVRSDFKVGPGTYVIRLVVRDSEGQTMAARNGAVEIP